MTVGAAARRGCRIPDCDRPHSCRGLCAMHYKRERRGADMDAPPYWRADHAPQPVICVCAAPIPGDVGGRECATCRRLIERAS